MLVTPRLLGASSTVVLGRLSGPAISAAELMVLTAAFADPSVTVVFATLVLTVLSTNWLGGKRQGTKPRS